MKIIYLSSLTSERYYSDYFNRNNIKTGQQTQKFHNLLVKGIQQNFKGEIVVLSAIPINNEISKKIFFWFKSEKIKDITYIYLPFINIKIFRQFFLFISCFIYLFFKLETKNTVIIYDSLNTTLTMSLYILHKVKKFKSIAIVTDIPQFLDYVSENLKFKFLNFKFSSQSMFIKSISFNNGFVFLTIQMNDFLNKNNRPYIVIEGMSDFEMSKITNELNKKYTNLVCMYTGLINRVYGISMLVHAFVKANIKNSELHIYGDGDFSNELKELSKVYKNIKYFGTQINDIIVSEQIKATLLINPRPTNQDYTKYSFPSKNLEYMASGTPVLTTLLPGMPKEYVDYVYLFEEENIDSFSIVLSKILNLTKNELHIKGILAKEFVVNKKNNIVQARKVLSLLERIVNEI